MNRLRPSFVPSSMHLFRFAMLWLAMLIAFVLVLHNGRQVVGALAVTRVDNLEVTGTTDATGVVTARAGVRLTAPTTGPIFISGTGSPNASVVATQGSIYLRTDIPSVWQNTSGGAVWAQTSVDQIATNRILGRITAGTGSPEALTGTQTTTLLDTFTSALKGLAPASGGGTANFLRADGTWAVPPGSGGGASNLFSVPGEGTCTFDGVTTPVCGATLSGSTYDAQRDMAPTTMTINAGVRVKSNNYKVSVHGALTVDGALDVNGGNGALNTGGPAQSTANTCGAGTNGGSPGSAGVNASLAIPYGIFPLNTTAVGGTSAPTAGGNGPSAGRGGGGGGAKSFNGGSAGASSGTMNSGGSYLVNSSVLFTCRLPNNAAFSGGTGGGPGGCEVNTTGNAGGGGGGGGVLVVSADILAGSGTISSNGGNGGNAGNIGANSACGGGGGGGGGILGLYFRTYSGSLTVSASGGSAGTGAASGGTGANGGSGAAGVVVCNNTSGDGTKPTGCP